MFHSNRYSYHSALWDTFFLMTLYLYAYILNVLIKKTLDNLYYDNIAS